LTIFYQNSSKNECFSTSKVQVILFETDCTIFYANLDFQMIDENVGLHI
jgi:hypothetical protein